MFRFHQSRQATFDTSSQPRIFQALFISTCSEIDVADSRLMGLERFVRDMAVVDGVDRRIQPRITGNFSTLYSCMSLNAFLTLMLSLT